MNNKTLLKECVRLRGLIRKLKANPTEEPYYSIQMTALTEALSVGRELMIYNMYRRNDES